MNVKDKYGRTPIVDALLKGHREVIGFLKANKAETECEKYTDKWLQAIVSEDKNFLKCFIEFGVDPNTSDYDMRTALHLAVTYKIEKVIELLVAIGADKDLQDRWGKSALDYAKTDDYQVALDLFYSKE